jgi:Predicted lactoylglutathione lyase
LSDTISAMLLAHAKFAEFTSQPIADTRNSAAAILPSSQTAATGAVGGWLRTHGSRDDRAV